MTGDILLRRLREWRSDVWCAGSILEMSLGQSGLVGQVPVTCGIDSIRIQKGQETNAGSVWDSFCPPVKLPLAVTVGALRFSDESKVEPFLKPWGGQSHRRVSSVKSP